MNITLTSSTSDYTPNYKNQYKVLIKLQEKPLAPASSLAKEIDVSTATVIKTINWLQSHNKFTDVHPDLNHPALDLQIIDILVKPTSFDAIKRLELRKRGHSHFPHPYILFHARMYGAYEGLFYQFQIPNKNKALTNLTAFFDVLIELGLVKNYKVLPRLSDKLSINQHTRAQLEAWEPNNYSWDFDGNRFIEEFDSYEIPNKENNQTIDASTSKKQIIDTLDEIDIILLSELTIDARRKNKEIGQAMLKKLQARSQLSETTSISYSSQDLSRRLTKLKDGVPEDDIPSAIKRFRLFLNWNTFDIYNTVFYLCDSNIATSQKIAKYLKHKKRSFPFESILVGLQKGFFWYLKSPSNVISFINEFLAKNVTHKDVSFLDARSSEIYALWPEVYDSNQNYWKYDREFMIDEPIEHIEEFGL